MSGTVIVMHTPIMSQKLKREPYNWGKPFFNINCSTSWLRHVNGNSHLFMIRASITNIRDYEIIKYFVLCSNKNAY